MNKAAPARRVGIERGSDAMLAFPWRGNASRLWDQTGESLDEFALVWSEQFRPAVEYDGLGVALTATGPGTAVFRAGVLNEDGKSLSMPQYVGRNLSHIPAVAS